MSGGKNKVKLHDAGLHVKGVQDIAPAFLCNCCKGGLVAGPNMLAAVHVVRHAHPEILPDSSLFASNLQLRSYLHP